MKERILIAGLGNIFMGDDAFGVEVVRELAQRRLPDNVRVVDFGIRAYDLAYALTDGYEAVVLVDAIPRGEAPGTTVLLELDLDDLPARSSAAPDGHSLDPVGVLQWAQALGPIRAKLFLVGCQPAVLESDQIELSAPVRAAVPQAVRWIEELIANSRAEESSSVLRWRPHTQQCSG